MTRRSSFGIVTRAASATSRPAGSTRSQGQQTFEEIRRRYRRDQEFKQTVDRYVEEFERLLGEVSRDDRDSKLRTSYLTSETGKVYTMLAHAAGRFD